MSQISQMIKANLARNNKQCETVFYQMWAFALTRANYLDLCGWTSAMWTYEVEAVPVTASGLTWPPHSSAPFDLVSHSTTIFPISWAFYYTIAYHVVTVAEPRGTWRLKCALIISGSRHVLRLALILDSIKCNVFLRGIISHWILWSFFDLTQYTLLCTVIIIWLWKDCIPIILSF